MHLCQTVKQNTYRILSKTRYLLKFHVSKILRVLTAQLILLKLIVVVVAVVDVIAVELIVKVVMVVVSDHSNALFDYYRKLFDF